MGMLEAQVDVTGTMGEAPVRGGGLWEVLPVDRLKDFEQHVTKVSTVVHAEVDRLYPPSPDRRALVALAGTEDRPERLDEAVLQDLHASLVVPIRHSTAGLGKGWRSYLLAAVIELFGGDSELYRPLLGALELLNTGNLIVDDVEDRSPLRRGRPAAHLVFGEDIAINAGTAAYFAMDRVLHEVLSDDAALRLRIYEVYLRVLRAGHGGQAIDLAGHRAAMDTAVRTGDAEILLRRVRTAHRLKTALPARGVAEVGALIAGARDDRIQAVGDYFEEVGLAFQISDDVADLRGLSAPDGDGGRDATKHMAEDLRAGKVTMPLAHAVALLPSHEITDLWHTVRDGEADEAAIAAAATKLEACGAVAACVEESRSRVDQAWKPLHDLLPCTWASIMMRALGAYAVHRERE